MSTPIGRRMPPKKNISLKRKRPLLILSVLTLCLSPMGILHAQLSQQIPVNVRTAYKRLGYFECALIATLYRAWTTTGYAGYTICSFYNVTGNGPLSLWVVTHPEDKAAIYGEIYGGSSPEDGINLAKRWIDQHKTN